MKVIASCTSLLLLVACAVPPVRDAPKLTPIVVPSGTTTNEIELGPVVARLSSDGSLGIQFGMLCQPAASRPAPADRLPVTQGDIGRAFKAVFGSLRYRTKEVPDSVFVASPAALRLGGTVTRLEASLCFPYSGSPALNVGDPSRAKGSAFVEVVWELYSTSEGRVIFKRSVAGRFETEETVQGGIGTVVLNALSASLTNLAADSEFYAAAAKPVP